ncbi:tyrosine-protein phosphatase [Nonomuraea sp. NPDC050556]|uniref:tyrosine-protein phosphatase n=1 Tax=Nonomuraea sp. NPDC050556 TaxID=3364369 RepID=UPI00379A3D7E
MVDTVGRVGDTLDIASAPNLRDVGGHSTTDGRKVKMGLAFRSGALDRLTGDEQQLLLEAGVKRVCDLRTRTERTDQPDRLPEGVHYRVLDVQKHGGHGADIASLFASPDGIEALKSPQSAEAFLVDVYRAFVTTPDAHEAFGELLRTLTKPGTLMHCTAGKDRTGWGSALLLTLLGVDRETVLADYLDSNRHLESAYAGLYEMVAQGGIDPEVVRPLLEVREVYLAAAFDTAQELYGDAEGYARTALGLTDQELTALKDLYLGDAG